MKKVKLAWQHINPESKYYALVRESTGGRHREMALSCESGYSEMIGTLIDLFLPNGESFQGQTTSAHVCVPYRRVIL